MPGNQPPRIITSSDIARYGHVTSLMRLYLKTFDLGPNAFTRAMGLRSSAQCIPWIKGYSAPGPAIASSLAPKMGVTVAHLVKRDPNGPPAPPLPKARELLPPPVSDDAPRTGRPPTASTALVLVKQPKPPVLHNVGDLLSYRIHNDGTATIEVRARLPEEHATSILRVLLEAGISKGANG